MPRRNRGVVPAKEVWARGVLKGTGLTPEQAPELLEVGPDSCRKGLVEIVRRRIRRGKTHRRDEAMMNVALGPLLDDINGKRPKSKKK